MNANWRNATKANPCPVCGHDSWCTMSKDGVMCVCRRVESSRPSRGGFGWLHILRENASRTFVQHVATPVREEKNPAPSYYAALVEDARFTQRLSRNLGVQEEALRRLGVRRDARHDTAAFPMRKADGTIVGIRFRAVTSGGKWSLKGGHDGLFIPEGVGAVPELVICEGASDTVAALSCGWPAVGRSSCGTGQREIVAFLREQGIRRVTVMADNDVPRRGADGAVRTPGWDGAVALARHLKSVQQIDAHVALPPEGYKDLRAWLCRGGVG